MTIYKIESVREVARKDAQSYDFPLLRFDVGSESQSIYDEEFEKCVKALDGQKVLM